MDTQASGAAQEAEPTGPRATSAAATPRRSSTGPGASATRPRPRIQPRCHPKVALADAVIALTTNIAARKGERIEFKEAWFDPDSDETPEGVKPDVTRYAYERSIGAVELRSQLNAVESHDIDDKRQVTMNLTPEEKAIGKENFQRGHRQHARAARFPPRRASRRASPRATGWARTTSATTRRSTSRSASA